MSLPSEIIAYIAQYIYEKDYVHLLQANKQFYEAIHYYSPTPYPMTPYQREAYTRTCEMDTFIRLTSFPYESIDIILTNYAYYYLKENPRGRILITCTRNRYCRWTSLLKRIFSDKVFFPEGGGKRIKENVVLLPSDAPFLSRKSYSPTLCLRDDEWESHPSPSASTIKRIYGNYRYSNEDIHSIHLRQPIPFSPFSSYFVHPLFERIVEEILHQYNKVTFLGVGLAWLLSLRRICRAKWPIYRMKDKKDFDKEEKAILFCEKDCLKVPLACLTGTIVVEVTEKYGEIYIEKEVSYSLLASAPTNICYYHLPKEKEKEWYNKRIVYTIFYKEVKDRLKAMDVPDDFFLHFLKAKDFPHIYPFLQGRKDSFMTNYSWRSKEYAELLYDVFKKESNNQHTLIGEILKI